MCLRCGSLNKHFTHILSWQKSIEEEGSELWMLWTDWSGPQNIALLAFRLWTADYFFQDFLQEGGEQGLNLLSVFEMRKILRLTDDICLKHSSILTFSSCPVVFEVCCFSVEIDLLFSTLSVAVNTPFKHFKCACVDGALWGLPLQSLGRDKRV